MDTLSTSISRMRDKQVLQSVNIFIHQSTRKLHLAVCALVPTHNTYQIYNKQQYPVFQRET